MSQRPPVHPTSGWDTAGRRRARLQDGLPARTRGAAQIDCVRHSLPIMIFGALARCDQWQRRIDDLRGKPTRAANPSGVRFCIGVYLLHVRAWPWPRFLAKQVIETARTGERNIDRLVENGVAYLREIK